MVVVADRGPGVPFDALPHLFDRFFKADPSRRRGSSGLGLAIAAEHAALLGATLRARARPGGGMLFVLTLPVTRSLPPGDAPTRRRPTMSAFGTRIEGPAMIRLSPRYRSSSCCWPLVGLVAGACAPPRAPWAPRPRRAPTTSALRRAGRLGRHCRHHGVAVRRPHAQAPRRSETGAPADDRPGRPSPPHPRPPTAKPTTAPTPGATTTLRAYFLTTTADGGIVVIPVLREVPEDQGRGRPPRWPRCWPARTTPRWPLIPAMYTTIPDGTKLLGISISNGVATVNLSREFESGGGSRVDPRPPRPGGLHADAVPDRGLRAVPAGRQARQRRSAARA